VTTKIKITRKQIKSPDEFLTLTARAIQWVEDHGPAIFTGLAAVAVVALIVAGVVSFLRYQDGKARNAMTDALAAYRAPEEAAERQTKEGEAPEGMTPAQAVESYRDAAAKFEAVHAQYANSDAGALALLYAGDAYYRVGDFAKSAANYEAFLAAKPNDPVLSPVAAEGLGYARESRGEFAKAAEAFEKTTGPTAKLSRPFGLLNAARCLAAAGDKAKAVALYEQFLQDYPDSSMKAAAAERLAALMDVG
jgi:tetratricopeptide (TPR) repeat protein